MPLLFLDFDGVLNNTRWCVSEGRRVLREQAKLTWVDLPDEEKWKRIRAAGDFDPRNMTNLKHIAYGVPTLEVVVSSTWRKGRTLEELRHLLRDAVPPERVIGVTGEDPTRERHREIRAWLDVYERTEDKWLALDDDIFDMEPLGRNFMHIGRTFGLCRHHADRAIRFFK